MSAPIVRVYDNGGETHDRYTVILEFADGDIHAFGMSENPSHPQGFNQYLGEVPWGCDEGPHLGKLLESVPECIKTAVQNRIG